MTTSQNTQLDELAQIKERAEAATEGPWRSVRGGVVAGREQVAEDVRAFHDADFIANARRDVPKLITALEAVLNLASHEPRFRPRMFDGEPFPIQVSADEIIETITEALR